jgi:type VI secretion system protein ImpH
MPVPESVFTRLFAAPYEFDFFQACRLLARLRPEGLGPPEPARFRPRLTLSFPASAVHDLTPPAAPLGLPAMTVTFLGLYGTTGVLPRHYTHRLLEIDQTTRQDAGRPMRDWLDIFNHRWTYLFYRAWDKYRFWLAHERQEPPRDDPDPFTRALLAVCGLATGGLRDRLRVDGPPPPPEPYHAPPPGAGGRVPVFLPPRPDPGPERLAVVHDLGLVRFAGLLAQRRRSAWGLDVLLTEYFEVPAAVQPFRGQWLPLDPGSRTRLGQAGSTLGADAVAGERVWDVQGKFRVRLGPLGYGEFLDYLPDRRPAERRKAFFLLSQVVQFFAGPEFDFDIQLVLKAAEVPDCHLTADESTGPRLGWNCWLTSRPLAADAEDAVFAGQPATRLDG